MKNENKKQHCFCFILLTSSGSVKLLDSTLFVCTILHVPTRSCSNVLQYDAILAMNNTIIQRIMQISFLNMIRSYFICILCLYSFIYCAAISSLYLSECVFFYITSKEWFFEYSQPRHFEVQLMAHALIALNATPLAFHALCLSVCERMFSISVL